MLVNYVHAIQAGSDAIAIVYKNQSHLIIHVKEETDERCR